MEFLSHISKMLSENFDQTAIISGVIFIFVAGLLLLMWIYNRRRLQNLTHQIPASIVKNYLDSIIQNSNALKSSLFRGGGLDIGEGIPAVKPVAELPSGGATGPSQDEFNRKLAEIAALMAQLADKDNQISDLQRQLADAQSAGASDSEKDGIIAGLREDKTGLEAKVKELEEALEKAKAEGSGGGDPAQLEAVTKERDELKERLMEYEIIEEDLANLKKLQQENDELKKEIEKLKAGGGAPAPAPEPEPEPEPKPEPEPAPAPQEDLESAMAAAIEEPAAEAAPEDVPQEVGEQKSAEELLSEFEKMLG